MEKVTESLVNVFMSVLAPVLILDHCSTEGEKLWHIGTTPAMIVALSLPLAYGIYHFIRTHKADAVNIMGLIGTLLTAFVTVYAKMGESGAIQADTPWWYAAKEATIPMLLAAAIVLTAKGSGSLLRVFVYTDGVFDIARIEKRVTTRDLTAGYQKVLFRASLWIACSLVVSSVANFALSLYFLLPVTKAAASEQALLYNYAVSDMTWWGYLIIGVPILIAFFAVIFYLRKALHELTGLAQEDIFLH